MERNDIVAMRVKFLRTIVNLRQNNDTRPVVYLDETWVNQNHTKGYIWQNEFNLKEFHAIIILMQKKLKIYLFFKDKYLKTIWHLNFL